MKLVPLNNKNLWSPHGRQTNQKFVFPSVWFKVFFKQFSQHYTFFAPWLEGSQSFFVLSNTINNKSMYVTHKECRHILSMQSVYTKHHRQVHKSFAVPIVINQSIQIRNLVIIESLSSLSDWLLIMSQHSSKYCSMLMWSHPWKKIFSLPIHQCRTTVHSYKE